jgi:putative toxin-antitoxin system antitoxin component (TIGR02293 family)
MEEEKSLRVEESAVVEAPPPARLLAAQAHPGKNRDVVRSFIQSSPSMGTAGGTASALVIRKLEAGLPVRELDDLQSGLDLPMDKVGALLGISKATLHRRRAVGRLDTFESDRVVRFARLLGKAVTVLESEEHARMWLSSPQFGLGGAVPLEYARTEVGAREVESLLGRIEHGVYS